MRYINHLSFPFLSLLYDGGMHAQVGDKITERILAELSCWCRAKSDYERFAFFVDVLVVLPLSVCGLAGNTLSVVLYIAAAN